ncbi:MAG: type II toxin-antitoxin system RelE/ParE family toxin [Nitratireductor sp.]
MQPILYRTAARKALRHTPTNSALRIVSKIESHANDRASLSANVLALRGREGIRLRVGDWRVIILDNEMLDILDIGPRGGIHE